MKIKKRIALHFIAALMATSALIYPTIAGASGGETIPPEPAPYCSSNPTKCAGFVEHSVTWTCSFPIGQTKCCKIKEVKGKCPNDPDGVYTVYRYEFPVENGQCFNKLDTCQTF